MTDLIEWLLERPDVDDADRRIIHVHSPDPERGGCCVTCAGWTESPCPTVRVLALPHAHLDGYRDEWAP